jgi:pyridoxal phosphate enzyme (YggS family)
METRASVIIENVKAMLAELPAGVELVAAAKTRNADEIRAAIAGGARIIGENYLQEAEALQPEIGDAVRWHFIGHLQRNKVNRAVRLFDMIQSLDSLALAQAIDRAAAAAGKVMPVLIEVNSGEETQKSGVVPEAVTTLAIAVAKLPNLKLEGLMTVGTFDPDPEVLRPCFALTRRLRDEVRALELPGVDLRYLSMGMTDSYRVAISEGANLIRIGTRLFGARSE